jgi:hypothetical protein
MQCPEGFYEAVSDLCGCSRFVAKSITLFAINAPTYAKLTAAINLDKAHETKANRSRKIPKPILYEELEKSGLKPKDIIEAFTESLPAIEKYLFSGSWLRLMLVESEITTAALRRLMELGIPALPVHDSIIAPTRHRDTTRRIMEEAYRQHTGFSIAVE